MNIYTRLLISTTLVTIFLVLSWNAVLTRTSIQIIKCDPINKNVQIKLFDINGVKYPRYLPKFLNETYNFECMNHNHKPKLILFWNNLYESASFRYGIGSKNLFEKQKCPVTNCETINDRNRVNESNLILFSLANPIEFPKWRLPHQRWVYYLSESPLHFKNYKNYSGIFNLSATYRSNSDFMNPYWSYYPRVWKENMFFDSKKDFFKGKIKFGFLVASNCHSTSQREEFIKSLQSYIQVDVYGKCGLKCPNKKDERVGMKCKEILSKDYKFYFAFENSLCTDYVSEKFFGSFNFDIIPVVYGLGNYDTYIPKSAYINVFDFTSIKSLTDYLIHVASNHTLYNSFFQWKRYVFQTYSTPGQICEMCILLNLETYYGIKHSVVEDLDVLWNKNNEHIDCFNFNVSSFKLTNYTKNS